MKISDITCSACGADYQMAEAMSVKGSSGEARCLLCGGVLAEWDDGALRAFRLVMSPEHRYEQVAAPPVANALR